MGARSTVVIQDGPSRVHLYGHWMACAAVDHAAHGLRSDRFDEPHYLARIVLCDMVAQDVRGETGFGVSGALLASEFPVLVIDSRRPDPIAPGPHRGHADVWFEDEDGGRLSRVYSREEFLAIAGTLPGCPPDPAATEPTDHDCAYDRFLTGPAGADQVSVG